MPTKRNLHNSNRSNGSTPPEGLHAAQYSGKYTRSARSTQSTRSARAGRSSNASRSARSTQHNASPHETYGGFNTEPEKKVRVSTEGVQVGDILLTRRTLLYGALGAGVVAGAGYGINSFMKKRQAENAPNVLSVPTSAVTVSTDLTEIENDGSVYLYAYMNMPYGTLMWSNDDEYAALLLPTETGSPLTQVGLLRLSSGYYFTVLTQAVGAKAGYDIYDVRANKQGLVWTEVDTLEGIWRIYSAPHTDGTLGEPVLLEEGDSEWETPTIAIVGNRAFWQILPSLSGSKTGELSRVKSAELGSSEASEVYTSLGRMSTPIYALDDAIVITPRNDTDSVHHELTLINAQSLEATEKMLLPTNMKPLEAGYGKTGFMFSFDGIYSYGDGIANLGTYVPKTDARGANHSDALWFHFARTPSAPPCWCGNRLLVKSTRSVCCINLQENSYFLIEANDASENYGEYLASTGNRKLVVTYANINDKSIEGGEEKYCSVRIWAAAE